MNRLSYISKQMRRINWDCPGAWTQHGVHALHWYPSSFIPQVASNLIELVSEPGDLVLDPFCGCGTTLVEAVRLGRSAIGVDSNSLGVLVSQVKSTEVDTLALSKELQRILTECSDDLFALPASQSPTAQELSGWFGPRTLSVLCRLREVIGSMAMKAGHRRFFQACLSHILRTTSSQDKHWGWIADRVVPKRLRDHDAVGRFARHAQNMVQAFEQMYCDIKDSTLTSIDILRRTYAQQSDCRYPITGVPTVDAVVTSPPYPCVTDYSRAQRLSFLFFNWDLQENENVEIGARWRRFRKRQMEEYVADIRRAFENVTSILKPGGLMGLVVDGTLRKRRDLPQPHQLDFAKLLTDDYEYLEVGEAQMRRFSSQRLVDRKANRNCELVVVLRKPPQR